MTDLYKEAILEAKKLREIAEKDAKQSIADAISPYIKKAITKQISEAMNPGSATNSGASPDVSSFFLEQDEDPTDPNVAATQPLTPGAAPVANTIDTTGAGLESNPIAGDTSMSAPLSLPNTGGQDIVNSSLDPQDGKITVNFEDLFLKASETPDDVMQSSTAPITPASPSVAPPVPATMPAAPTSTVAPVPVVPEPTGEFPEEEPIEAPLSEKTFMEWKNKLNEVSQRVDEAYFSSKTPEVVKESLKMKLFELLGTLDSLKENGIVNSKQVKINENKLEFLFIKLKDAKLNNSYIENDKREEYNMTSLKEYAARLFEENHADETTTASAKHAAKVSGVGPDVVLEGEGSLAGSVSEMPLDKGKPELAEKDQDKVIEEALDSIAEGHEGFGPEDTSEKPTTSFDGSFTQSELKEAIKHLRKESVKKKMKKLKESTESWEDGKPANGADPALKNLSKKNSPSDALKQPKGPGITVVAEDLELGDDEEVLDDEASDFNFDSEGDDTDMDLDMDLEGDDADLVINIDLPDEVEAALADIDMSALDDITASLGDVNFGRSDESTESLDDLDDDEEVEVTDMDDDEEVDMDDEDMPVESVSMPSPSMGMMQEAKKRNKLLESKVVAASKALKEQKTQIATLQSELQEANLFIAKSVYFTKCLQRGDLSKANLTKIAEHLDRAKTVQETKEIYSKIKNKLAESVAASKKLTGTASQATNHGSAPTLNENVNRNSDQGDVIASRRWQTLAGIKIPNDK